MYVYMFACMHACMICMYVTFVFVCVCVCVCVCVTGFSPPPPNCHRSRLKAAVAQIK